MQSTISPTTARRYHYTPIVEYHNHNQYQDQYLLQHRQSSPLQPKQPAPNMTRLTSLPPFRLLLLTLPLVMIVSIIELSFVSAMVGFLHGRANGFFELSSEGNTSPSGANTLELHGKPRILLEDQGHTSNGAAGTGFVLIGCGGLLLIWWERRRLRNTRGLEARASGLFTTYVVLTVLSALLALAALIYTFVITANHENQTIDLAVVAANPAPTPYPDQEWTPENWFGAVLNQLPLVNESDKSDLRGQLKIMRGWRWNLIPLFLVDLLVAGVAVWEWVRLRKGNVGGGGGMEVNGAKKGENGVGRDGESL